MATIYPTGMGYKTARQFRRVVDDIMKYANSVYEYSESNPAGGPWYDSHATQSPIFYPTHVSTPSSSIIGRRDRRKTSR